MPEAVLCPNTRDAAAATRHLQRSPRRRPSGRCARHRPGPAEDQSHGEPGGGLSRRDRG